MAEERDGVPAEENAGLNLSTVARILMTSNHVRNEDIVDGEEEKEDGRVSPPPPTSSTQPSDCVTPPTTSTNAPVVNSVPVIEQSVHSQPEDSHDRHTDDQNSDTETEIIVDECHSPTDLSTVTSELSPDSYDYSPLNYTSTGLKALKCPMCDYTTNDKSNFRRHKRLHNRSNPATVLKCGKCEYTTVLPRKIREHYCHEHNEDYGPVLPHIASSTSIVIPAYQDNRFNGSQHIDLSQGHCSSSRLDQSRCSVAGVGSSGLHTLLTSDQTHGIHFARSNPILPNCINQFTYDSPTHRIHEDRTIASDYLRSIVSNIIPTPRVPATSTITSSSFYLPHVVESSQNLSPNGQKSNRNYRLTDEEQKMKFKSEPIDNDDASDVSSSAIPLVIHSREIPRPMEAQTTQRLSIDVYEGTAHTDHNSEDIPSTNHIFDNRRKYSRGSTSHNISIKCETSHIGIQCSLPIVKQENSRWENQGSTDTENRSVQCDLTSARRPGTRESADSDSQNVDTRCSHCGVTFDDEVLFSIHIGCHSHTDPFVCNVCGKQCSNKYGFYSHIMRGHQS